MFFRLFIKKIISLNKIYPILHGDGNEQHIEAFKDNVATITDPDVGNEDHDIQCCTAEGGERT